MKAPFTLIALCSLLTISTSTSLQGQCTTSRETGDVTGNVNFGTSINWANPNRVELSDDLHARTSMSSGDTSKYLYIADFDYVIPLSATITGIEVVIERQADPGAGVYDASVKLFFGTNPLGTEHANASAWSETGDEIITYGGPTDLWGMTLTPTDVMSTDFGVGVSATCTDGPGSLYAYIDHMTVLVYYDSPDEPCLLPITLQSFNAVAVGKGAVQLDWLTATEINNDYFTVEKSTDGRSFSVAGTVDALNKTTPTSYTFTDENAFTGTSFYRLRQTDFNGTSTYSQVVEVNVSSTLSTVAYPNPATSQLTFTISGTENAVKYQLLDLKGSLVMESEITSDEGFTATLDVSGLNRGVYLLRTVDGSTVQTNKIILQ